MLAPANADPVEVAVLEFDGGYPIGPSVTRADGSHNIHGVISGGSGTVNVYWTAYASPWPVYLSGDAEELGVASPAAPASASVYWAGMYVETTTVTLAAHDTEDVLNNDTDKSYRQ